MKYANLTLNSEVVNNIGENIQILAIDNLYKYMGIPEEDIIRIDFMKMQEYDGEYVILPINWYFHQFFKYGTIKPFSDRIIPIFLGASFVSNIFSDAEIAFLKKCEPIGCRDEWTFNNLKRLNIDVYLNGCMTSCFPKRESNEVMQKKVFCVDMPEELAEYLPKEIEREAKYVTHVYDGKIDNINQFTKAIFEKYQREARLVVTSRLHCASPCMAAGIPVILAIPSCIYTFGWIERYIPIYTREEFGNIDWSPCVAEFEEEKVQILENAKQRLEKKFLREEGRRDISYYFETRNTKKQYIIPAVTPTIEYIISKFNKEEEFEYGFWGITGIADMIYEFVDKNFPNAKLKKVYDKGYAENQVLYHGIMPEKPMNEQCDKVFLFVTAYSATEEARNYFNEVGRNPNSYYLCCNAKSSF